MNKRNAGNISGSHYEILELPDLVITDTAYTLEKVDWHYHEHPYFTFLLQGKMKEVSAKQTHCCTAGSLLFHFPGDEHYNLRLPDYTRGFHIEIRNSFFERHQLLPIPLGGSEMVANPAIKLLFRRLLVQQKIRDEVTPLAFDEQLLSILDNRTFALQKHQRGAPWIKKVRDMMHQAPAGTLTWGALADYAEVHPAYLSRAFPKYFNSTASDYLRNLKLEGAANTLTNNPEALTQLAYQYGFADQSHFIRWFKTTIGITPKQYQKIIGQG